MPTRLDTGHPLDPVAAGTYSVHNPEGLPTGSYFVFVVVGPINGISCEIQQAFNANTGASYTRVRSETGWTTWSEVMSTASTVATPEVSVLAGSVEEGTDVTLTCATPGASIYYTVDGSTPDSTDTLYTTPIEITDDVTIKAVAYRDGFNSSAVVTAVYEIFVTETPEFSLAAGEVEDNSELVITCATPGASIYYTVDGEDPDTGDTLYENPITITDAVTIKAIAVRTNYKDSAIASVSYTIAA